jgi:uncharacterized protein YbjQ (UPF0145 family)
MLITTSFDLPGYDVLAVQGEVFGLTVRARNIGAGCVAGLRSIGGGEIPGFTKLLLPSRNEAMARMVEEAKARGANDAMVASGDMPHQQEYAVRVSEWRDPASAPLA